MNKPHYAAGSFDSPPVAFVTSELEGLSKSNNSHNQVLGARTRADICEAIGIRNETLFRKFSGYRSFSPLLRCFDLLDDLKNVVTQGYRTCCAPKDPNKAAETSQIENAQGEISLSLEPERSSNP